MSLIRTVLFDLDGTLVDSKRGIINSFMIALSELAINPVPEEERITALIGRPLRDMVVDLGLDLDEGGLDSFVSAYRADYSVRCVKESVLYPGVESTLMRLRPAKLGIVTTKRQDTALALSRGTGLDLRVDHIQGWERGLSPKPAPDTLFAAMNVLGASPESTIMVGDTEHDILAGKAAGVFTCAALYGYGDKRTLLDAEPDFVIECFSDLLPVLEELAEDEHLTRGQNAG